MQSEMLGLFWDAAMVMTVVMMVTVSGVMNMGW